MRNKNLSFFRLLVVATACAVLITACNENANTKTTIVVDSTKMKKTEKVIDTTAESRPLQPGG